MKFLVGELSRMLTTLSKDEFKQKYNHEKPTKDTTIIVSCRSGKRSAMAQMDLQNLGYKK